MSNDPRISEQYRTATRIGGYSDRPDRALIEVAGKDRAEWLSNLVTNVVKTLQPGEGNYAFAVSIKGRTIFDLNILVIEDRLWLDVDHRWKDTALRHFDRYIITEDVRLSDITSRHARLAIVGPRAREIVAEAGFGNLVPMSQLQHVGGTIDGMPVRMLRHDFIGLPGAEFILPADSPTVQEQLIGLARSRGLVSLDSETLEILRIEAGIPASVVDIDEDVVPPETGQVERGISYHKGCYLGQEVIERMRSHGILARQFVGLKIETSAASSSGAAAVPPRGAVIRANEKEIGRVTSACWSEALAAPLALGYVKTPFAKPGTIVEMVATSAVASSPASCEQAMTVQATIVALPVAARACQNTA